MLQNRKEPNCENIAADEDPRCDEGNEDSENSKTATQQEGEDEGGGVKVKVEFVIGGVKSVRMDGRPKESSCVMETV